MRFRSKLIEIDAECFIKDKPLPFRDERAVCYDGFNWYVEARGRRIVVDPGDWIIREPDGKGFYPCKPDIFVQRYEPITAEALNADAIGKLVEAAKKLVQWDKKYPKNTINSFNAEKQFESIIAETRNALKPFTEQPNAKAE